MMRDIYLKVELLRALDQCSGYLLPEPMLLQQLRLVLQPPPITSEFSRALQDLDAKQLVTGVQSPLGGPVKWGLTDKGRAELNQH